MERIGSFGSSDGEKSLGHMTWERQHLCVFPISGTTRKRDDYLEWPEYFMAVAFLSAQRSKDPSSQVSLCHSLFESFPWQQLYN